MTELVTSLLVRETADTVSMAGRPSGSAAGAVTVRAMLPDCAGKQRYRTLAEQRGPALHGTCYRNVIGIILDLCAGILDGYGVVDRLRSRLIGQDLLLQRIGGKLHTESAELPESDDRPHRRGEQGGRAGISCGPRSREVLVRDQPFDTCVDRWS